MKTFVFTEIVNCAKIGKIAIESYLKYHNYPVHVFGTADDFEQLGPLPAQVVKSVVDSDVLEKYKRGHEGTAYLFQRAMAWAASLGCSQWAHFDGDVFFKKECLSDIKSALDGGYDIVGTRRCYGNNPGLVSNLHAYPDTVSTYFIGVKLSELPDYDGEFMAKMIQGALHPLRWPVLDFFDPVTHCMIDGGAKIKFLDWNEYGSQNSEGKKTNNYELNLHMDNGSKLTHFGGVGSGYSYFKKQSSPEKSYGEWALGRYALFAKVFYNEDTGYRSPTVYGNDGRWISGSYDDHILELVKKEIQ